jgi:hypothetical protein
MMGIGSISPHIAWFVSSEASDRTLQATSGTEVSLHERANELKRKDEQEASGLY